MFERFQGHHVYWMRRKINEWLASRRASRVKTGPNKRPLWWDQPKVTQKTTAPKLCEILCRKWFFFLLCMRIFNSKCLIGPFYKRLPIHFRLTMDIYYTFQPIRLPRLHGTEQKKKDFINWLKIHIFILLSISFCHASTFKHVLISRVTESAIHFYICNDKAVHRLTIWWDLSRSRSREQTDNKRIHRHKWLVWPRTGGEGKTTTV